MAEAIVASVEYRELPEFPGYRFGSDGSVWSRWTSASNGSHGRISVLGHEWRMRQPVVNPASGYVQAQLRITKDGQSKYKTVRVHIQVLRAFKGNAPKGMQACHNNGKRSDNRIDNLRWDTAKENALDRTRHGTARIGARHHHAKLAVEQVVEIKTQYQDVGSFVLAKRYGVTQGAIDAIRSGKSWRHVVVNGKSLLGPLIGRVK